jgi:hypothetical protein
MDINLYPMACEICNLYLDQMDSEINNNNNNNKTSSEVLTETNAWDILWNFILF